MSRRLTPSGLFRVFTTIQFALVGLITLEGVAYALPGLHRLPQRVAVSALAVGLVAVFPLRFDGWGIRPLYQRLAHSTTIQRWIEGYRPLQFASVSLVLLLAAIQRLPSWITPLWAQLRDDLVSEPLVEVVIVWSLLALIVSAGAALLAAFGGLTIIDALFGRRTHAEAADSANLVVMWNVTTIGIAVACELNDLFAGALPEPWGWRWWIGMFLAAAIVRSTLVISVLLAADWLQISLDAALAPKIIETRPRPWITGLALIGVGAWFLWLESLLGLAAAAAIVVLATYPLSWGLRQ